jgi:uncharacterized protein (DUF2252 family)
MARFAKLSPFEVLQQPIEAADRALPRGTPSEPERRDAWLARRLIEPGAYVTRNSGGERRLVENSPLSVHVENPAFASEVRDAYDGYLRSLPDQVSKFLQRYALVDQARQVLGIAQAARGDVLLLLVRREDGEELLLKLKRPGSSVLEPYVDANPYGTEAERVVRGQRLLQAATDTYLGWTATADGGSRYVTRLRPMLPMELHQPGKRGKFLANYGRACATALARGHARSGDAATIAGHLGNGPAFDDAIAMFARSYAEQTDSDYRALTSAVRAGRLVTSFGK